MKPQHIETSTYAITKRLHNPAYFLSFFCLDAPLVAAGWALVISHDSNHSTDWLAIGGLFFAVWCIYLFDRLWDVRKTPEQCPPTSRHQFALSNRPFLFGLALCSTLAALFFVLPDFHPQKLRNASFLAVVVVIYFLIFRFRRGSGKGFGWIRKIPGKELAIGICFSGGIFVASGASLRSFATIVLFLGMAALFSLNCLLIAEAEIEIDREYDSASFFIQNGVQTLPYFPLLIGIALSGVAIAVSGTFLFSAISLIAGSLLTLFLVIPRVRRASRFVQPFADAVLLLPWCIIGISILLESR